MRISIGGWHIAALHLEPAQKKPTEAWSLWNHDFRGGVCWLRFPGTSIAKPPSLLYYVDRRTFTSSTIVAWNSLCLILLPCHCNRSYLYSLEVLELGATRYAESSSEEKDAAVL